MKLKSIIGCPTSIIIHINENNIRISTVSKVNSGSNENENHNSFNTSVTNEQESKLLSFINENNINSTKHF